MIAIYGFAPVQVRGRREWRHGWIEADAVGVELGIGLGIGLASTGPVPGSGGTT